MNENGFIIYRVSPECCLFVNILIDKTSEPCMVFYVIFVDSVMFTKGQEVTLFVNWDNKGTVRIVHLTVHSCGKKQMILHDDNGEKFEGRLFRPTEAQIQFGKVLPRVADAEATEIAHQIGAEIVAFQRAEITRAIETCRHSAIHPYVVHMKKELDLLHEPRAFFYAGPVAA